MSDHNRTHIQHLEMIDISKRFPGVLANDHISFDVHAGEIHALLGENGAGKSTLMRQLYGLYRPDEGQIKINGEVQHFRSPEDAINAGIGMIHQHFMLCQPLSVVENVALGLKSSRGFVLDLDVVEKRILELSEQYGLKVEPRACIWQLAVGEQQRVEIIKALYRGADLLILDEPTAVLTPQEVDDFFKTLRQMVAHGHALIFISHKLHEVLSVSDRITVLRDGRFIGTYLPQEVTKEQLAEKMVGREILLQYDRPVLDQGRVRLHIDDLWVKSDRGGNAVKGISLDVHGGEIIGVAGVSGNGQREFAEALSGLRPVQKGTITLDAVDLTHASPAEHIAAGLSYIPEERMRDGAIRDFSVSENLILLNHNRPPFSNRTFLDFPVIEKTSHDLVDSYDVKTPSIDTLLKNLSGGNIQKLILARELSRQPKLIIAAQPTRGVDVGASEYIHERLLEQRLKGAATLLISEDLDEIRALSDRIIVIFEGHIVGEVDGRNNTLEQLGLLMAGERETSLHPC